jgi:hypothetical protein
MTEQFLNYSCVAVIMWIHASDLLELAIGVGGAWLLLTAILLTSPS